MDQNRESKQQQQPRKKIQKKRPSIDGPNIQFIDDYDDDVNVKGGKKETNKNDK